MKRKAIISLMVLFSLRMVFCYFAPYLCCTQFSIYKFSSYGIVSIGMAMDVENYNILTCNILKVNLPYIKENGFKLTICALLNGMSYKFVYLQLTDLHLQFSHENVSFFLI